MVGWSHLPLEIKQHVVKKLDFMSRHSLKCTSYTDRQIVNSTPLNIPRVRFGHKDGRCLIVIYTGVEQFLRWELFDEDDGVRIEKCENSHNTDRFMRISIDNVDSLQMGTYILKTLLAHKSIKIDVFEWDFPCEKEDEVPEKMHKIIGYVDEDEFRATELLAISFFDSNTLLSYANVICCDVKKWNMLYRDQFDNNIIPRQAIEYKTVTEDISCAATIILHKPNDRVQDTLKSYFEQAKQVEKTAITCTIEMVLGANKSPARQIQRSEEDGLIKLTCTTKCGKYTMTMLPKDEQYLRDQLVGMKCGMSWLCKSCADPFEYWYHQNLTMRLVHEPFWAFSLKENGEPSAQLMKLLEQKVNKRPKPFKSSWGFKKLPPKLQTSEKPNQMKSQELEKEVKERGKATGISKFLIWFGVLFVGYFACFVVSNLVK